MFALVALVPPIIVVTALLLGARAVRALERRSSSGTEIGELRERLHALEDTVDG